MNDKLSAALAKRLAAYSATAGLTLALAPDSGAQIVYTDSPDCEARSNGPCYLDFDQDGDAEVILDRYMYNFNVYGAAFLGDGPDAMYAALAERVYNHGTLYNIFRALPAGIVVGPMRTSLVLDSKMPFSTEFGTWDDDGYFGVGFKLDDPGEVHFGWGRFEREYTTGGDDYFILMDFAYETTPGGSIKTGQTERLLLLAGEASPLIFPPSGGTLQYEATLTNSGPDPVTVDVWFNLRPNPEPLPPQHLGMYVVPAGSSIQRSFSAEIPASLAPGHYVAMFYLGDFSSSQSFTIEKVAGTASEQGAPEQAGTHTLSGASPNPSTGRARLTLGVARTQAVRLTVHDALGREVATLYDGVLPAGTPSTFTFDGTSLPAGVYAVRVVGEDFADTRTLTLLE